MGGYFNALLGQEKVALNSIIQQVSSAAFASGVIPINQVGTILLFGAPTAFTMAAPTIDGLKLRFWVFGGATARYTITSTFTFPGGHAGASFILTGGASWAEMESRGGRWYIFAGTGLTFTVTANPVASGVFATALQDVSNNISADGPINAGTGQAPCGSMFITKGSAAALTLVAPAAGTDDGMTVTIVSTTAFAHAVTTPPGIINGANATLTFGAAVANLIVLRAFNGLWYVLANTGVVIT